MGQRANFTIRKIPKEELPPQLLEIPQPPEFLYAVGAPLEHDAQYLAVVGARKYSPYGADACEQLILGLAESGIVIVSGLARGIDSIAHRAALKAGLKTVAFPGSGLGESYIYPAITLSLAKEILLAGGTLVSEFEPNQESRDWFFPQRNRLMAGIGKAVLVIEAADKSGTLITARMALDYNRDVLAVPGPITSLTSWGPNRLIRQGAVPITCSEDILEAFGRSGATAPLQKELPIDLTDDERQVLALLSEPKSRDDIIGTFDVPAHEMNVLLSVMEIKGLILEEFGEVRRT